MSAPSPAELAQEKLARAFREASNSGYGIRTTGVDLRRLAMSSDLAARAVEAIFDSELPDESHLDYEEKILLNRLNARIETVTRRNRT